MNLLECFDGCLNNSVDSFLIEAVFFAVKELIESMLEVVSTILAALNDERAHADVAC